MLRLQYCSLSEGRTPSRHHASAHCQRAKVPIHVGSHIRTVAMVMMKMPVLEARHCIRTVESSRLRDRDFQLWMDKILLPIVFEQYSSAHVQHYPSSYDHSRFNATARGVETHAQRIDPMTREQQSNYYLPPECLSQVWESIFMALEQPAHLPFRGVAILLRAKNLRAKNLMVLTRDVTWELMMSRFQGYWSSAVDETYLTSDFYFDIGMEVCPRHASYVALQSSGIDTVTYQRRQESRVPVEILLPKRCCLESYIS